MARKSFQGVMLLCFIAAFVLQFLSCPNSATAKKSYSNSIGSKGRTTSNGKNSFNSRISSSNSGGGSASTGRISTGTAGSFSGTRVTGIVKNTRSMVKKIPGRIDQAIEIIDGTTNTINSAARAINGLSGSINEFIGAFPTTGDTNEVSSDSAVASPDPDPNACDAQGTLTSDEYECMCRANVEKCLEVYN